MNVAPFKTSETWILLVNVLLQFLVGQGVIPTEYAAAVNALAVASIPVLFQTIFKKLRTGLVPFVHPTPSPSATAPATPPAKAA